MKYRKTALVGHTGFVGSNLQRSAAFGCTFNSTNIAEMAGHHFDFVVCSGISAVKWWANKNPEEDWKRIESLLNILSNVRADRFVLISTVDVYASPIGVDENTPDPLINHAYGSHRLKVEIFVREHFKNYHIIRLPGLFGIGLKKNVIFDLLTNNCLDAINPDSTFQYYFLDRLWADIGRVVERDLHKVNLATEPVSTRAILDYFSPCKQVGENAASVVRYDMQTAFASEFGREGRYLYDRDEVLRDLRVFVDRYRLGP